MGHNKDDWYKYHRVKGHDTVDCLRLKREIEKLIQSGRLRGYAKEKYDEDRRRPDGARDNRRGEETRHTRNTISGVFAGGGESSTS